MNTILDDYTYYQEWMKELTTKLISWFKEMKTTFRFIWNKFKSLKTRKKFYIVKKLKIYAPIIDNRLMKYIVSVKYNY